MTCQKERAVLANVLELYKDMPNLWNRNHHEYKNKHLRDNGFCVLLEVYKKFDSDATIKSIKRKIDNMRTNYLKEAKKVVASEHSDAAPEDVYVPSLWYFEALTFLGLTTEDYRPLRYSVVNVVSNKNSSSSEEEKCLASVPYKKKKSSILQKEENNSSSSEEEHSRASAPCKKKKRSILQKQENNSSSSEEEQSLASAPCKKKKRSILQKQENVKNRVEKQLSTKEEEWEVYGRSIGFQLRDLKRRELAIAQKLIGDVIYYAKMGRITEDTHITLGSTLEEYRVQSPQPSP